MKHIINIFRQLKCTKFNLKYEIYILIVFCVYMMSLSEIKAKRYPFKFNALREVYVVRSAKAGFKMVKVVAYGRNADKAIEKAMVDAVVSLTFYGALGEDEMENIPAILLDGPKAYEYKKSFFDNFFLKGEFMSYVKKVNSGYPIGKNNVKTSRGRKIQILLLVDWNGLAKKYANNGFKTVFSELSIY